MSEIERQKVVSEAISWLNTPYHKMGRKKGCGCDCGTFLLEVFLQSDVIPELSALELENYSINRHLHKSDEYYLSIVKDYGKEIHTPPQPGDVILYQFGKCINHGAIVIDYPRIIHSVIRIGVLYDDASRPELIEKQKAVYSYWNNN